MMNLHILYEFQRERVPLHKKKGFDDSVSYRKLFTRILSAATLLDGFGFLP